jgi:hypothetical protein
MFFFLPRLGKIDRLEAFLVLSFLLGLALSVAVAVALLQIRISAAPRYTKVLQHNA